MTASERYDVVIIGGGLAGLSLARHLLLATSRTVLLVERRPELPSPHQKVGESTVQLSAYYFSKVLDLEPHLLSRQLMKYNLRFYWTSAGASNAAFEDYSQAYIRSLSNIACYQLDRNAIEAEMLRLNRQHATFDLAMPATGLAVSLGSGEAPHQVTFTVNGACRRVEADWVVDTSGRGKCLAKKMNLRRDNSIRHGTSFFWVDGLVDIEKLTERTPREIRLQPYRRAVGHLPLWLATNHFMGEGYWFWVIPLQGKTSLGLVYDNRLVPRQEVETPARLIDWVCRQFPLFARDLPFRTIVDQGSFRDFSYDCEQTMSGDRWALSGEAGRFSDPFYSPGSDLISLHNTLIVDAITTADPDERRRKCAVYEQLARALYRATEPTYGVSYDALGDQEVFVLKYTWELSIYFGFYVFPFINELFTDQAFIPAFMARFSRLGRLNDGLQRMLSDYYNWKKLARPPAPSPMYYDFMSLPALRLSEQTFYQVGCSAREAAAVLDAQLTSLTELARFMVAHVAAATVGDPEAVRNRRFVAAIDLSAPTFDPAAFRAWHAAAAGSSAQQEWSFDPAVLRPFVTDVLAGGVR